MAENADNPYRSPTRIPESLVDRSEPTEDELRAFFGDNAEYYLTSWAKKAEHGWWAGFNWAAFLFFLMWCLYRKLYLVFFIAFGFLTALGLANLPVAVYWVICLAAWISCGMLGNHIYLRRARSVISRYRQSAADPDEQIRLISKAGGRSRVALALGLVILVGPQLLSSMYALPFWALVVGVAFWLSRRPGTAAGVLNLHSDSNE
jgi:hypothetical protein